MENKQREIITEIPVDRIRRGVYQPRREFNQRSLEDLAATIREVGVIQPLVVRPVTDADYDYDYELIAGERRWRASQLAELYEVPCIVRANIGDEAALKVSLIENLQREDLTPIEEAEAFQRLIEEFKLRHDDMAIQAGKSRVYITNTLRLLRLDPTVQEDIHHGRLTASHGKELGALEYGLQRMLAKESIVNNMSVEQLKSRITVWTSKAKPRTTPSEKEVYAKRLGEMLGDYLGAKVSVQCDKKTNGGSWTVYFYSNDELEGQLEKIHFDTEL